MNCHTSVVACREKAKRAGGSWKCLGLDEMERGGEHWPVPSKPSLVVIPMECNFSGRVAEVKRIVDCVKAISDQYYVCVDVAKYAAFNKIELEEIGADFAVGSFYKIFGSPTGLGFLFLRKSAVEAVINPRHYGGGGVSAILPNEDFTVLRKNVEEVFEPGTINFRGIISLRWGFDNLDDLGGADAMKDHVQSLTREFKRVMGELGGDDIEFHSHESR